MKYRVLTLGLCLLLMVSLFAGCDLPGSTSATTRPNVEEKEISVVATVFPGYDWARQIIGENSDHVALTLLLDKGTDLHSYQPTVEDIYKISTCDLFIYVGGGSDKWVPDALAQAANKDMVVINLLEALGDAAKEEELVEGMESDHDHQEDHEEEHEEDHDHQEEHENQEHEAELDEHVWLSLRNAQLLCQSIETALETLDPAGRNVYLKNLRAYTEKLDALDQSYADVVAGAARHTLLFADRFPFRYLVEDYGLAYFAAFAGCSAETEASFDTVNFLVGKVDALNLPYVMILETGDDRLAQTIISNSRDKNAQVLTLDSLQAVTAQRVEEGTTYLSIMEKNLEALKTALN